MTTTSGRQDDTGRHNETAAAVQDELTRLSSDQISALCALPNVVVYQRLVMPDGQIRYTYISEGVRELFGIAPEEVLADPTALFSRHDPTYAADFRERGR